MHPKNSNNQNIAQDSITTQVDFCNTPISNTGTQMLQVVAGIDSRDAIQQARTLASGLGQICQHMHDSLNYGEMTYTDGMATLQFVAESVSAILWSVQRGLPSEIAEREQA
ncbi:hypothetical protein GIR22_08465 [Pseudomonas sp. CCM 7891]|uniref:DUF3077 domain-containing protein n=1 Tax=Pseudomonas karstica TaxID=1055468 RepID=A0A7X2UY61_9PSED|nr:hypothetical protein [Pseudomonas karstica]MTD19183.1 hypothetical protein [Pseudomonas karstica]